MKLHMGNQDINLNNAGSAFKLYNDKLLRDMYYDCTPVYTASRTTTNSIGNPQMKGKFIVNKILPYQSGDDIIEKVKQRTLTIVSSGFKDYETTLYVTNPEPTTNEITLNKIETNTGGNNGFDWEEDTFEYGFNIVWDNSPIHIGGFTRYFLGKYVHYKDDNCEFTFNHTGGVKLTRNEVVFEDNITTEGYLGTYILSFEHYFNGEKFDETTQRYILLAKG